MRALLALSAGKPCPTNAEIAATLGLTVSAVRSALVELARLRVIRAQKNGERGAHSRRVRVLIAGQWSAWSKWSDRAQKSTTADHVALVLASGSYENACSSKRLTEKAA